MTIALVVLIVAALAFDFLNGFHDSSNIVATMISSRAFSGRRALALTALCEFLGPLLFGVAVATTIGHEVVAAHAITLPVITAALFGAISWNLFTWFFGIPSSSSHALVGGIVGSVLVEYGRQAILAHGIAKVLAALLISPPIGLVAGYLIQRLTLFLLYARGCSPRVNWYFKRGQLITAVGLALSHGANDAQKTMGIIAMGLVAAGSIDTFYVPTWVIVVSAGAIAFGTWVGGWRLIRTLGYGFYRIRPIHALTSQVASAGVILAASLAGGPVSTTQVVSSSIVGAGSAERVSKVRWRVAQNIVVAWFLTIPASAAVAAGVYLLLRRLPWAG